MVKPGPQLGLSRLATVRDINFENGTMRIVLNDAKNDVTERVHNARIPASWTGPGGEFAGGTPIIGATISVTQEQGGSWVVQNYSLSDGVFGSNTSNSNRGFRRNKMRALKPGRHLIQVKNNIRHIVDPTIGISSGDPNQFIHTDPVLGINSTVFNSNMEFTEANRSVVGPVLRDTKANATRNVSGDALTSHDYKASLFEVGLDPKSRTGDSFTRNPAFNESREIIYEFRESFGFTHDLQEYSIYDGEEIPSDNTFFPRYESRADALSLSLVNPNHLIETIKGTVVDLYGNIVDLNRNILPNGLIDSLSFRDNEGNPSETFRNLRRESRKSIAYHFEINARKDELPDLNNIDFFVDDNADFSRQRSKFFFDIDKEGQFKMNVPASSETGNIGLPVRYENYSVISSAENDTDPREFVRNVNSQDIFLDSFGKGVISLSGTDDGGLKGFAAPVDRITEETIKLGTVFHDMSKTLSLHSLPEGIKPIPLYPDSKINNVPKVKDLFSDEVIVSGDNANAGGRSGTITLDGQLSLSIGANTVDRQSLWLDCAGGVISNIGRDVNDISYAGRFDGDIFVQIGGTTPSDDSRFNKLNNTYKEGALDIRVAAGNLMHVFRIDNTGMRVYSVGEVDIVSEGDLSLRSRKGNVYIDGEGIYMYANNSATSRKILRKPGKSID